MRPSTPSGPGNRRRSWAPPAHLPSASLAFVYEAWPPRENWARAGRATRSPSAAPNARRVFLEEFTVEDLRGEVSKLSARIRRRGPQLRADHVFKALADRSRRKLL